MNTLRLSHVGALHSPPETGAEMPFMQLALVYPMLFGPCIACGCSDILWKTHKCKKRDFPSCSGIQFATCWSGLAFANLVWLEMLERSARDWSKIELQPWLGMSRIWSYCHTSNVTPQSKDDFCAFQDKAYKRRKTCLCWVKLMSQEPRETCWCEIQTRGDITKPWCHKTPESVSCHACLFCLSWNNITLFFPHFVNIESTLAGSSFWYFSLTLLRCQRDSKGWNW